MKINRAEAFYTGGGIYISGIHETETRYCTIDNDSPEYLNFFSTDGEDHECFACQNLIESKHIDTLNDAERRVYIRLLKALHKAMLNGGYVEKDPCSSFLTDDEKMHDFFRISKKEFLFSYSYLTEEEYDMTVAEIKEWLKKVEEE